MITPALLHSPWLCCGWGNSAEAEGSWQEGAGPLPCLLPALRRAAGSTALAGRARVCRGRLVAVLAAPEAVCK